ncbi:arylsulfatase [Maribacter sp. ACAM166]|uniref:arylsulfatase n=1 Tax=Maribacter sp. ACAM166 TaxID=2508996 RepID=UPI0010FD4295|nr:arylsulfatase [Maribacter sp. ACAM166]TLP71929.1 arylsulfatase [Maribacter sp. ACAM166]
MILKLLHTKIIDIKNGDNLPLDARNSLKFGLGFWLFFVSHLVLIAQSTDKTKPNVIIVITDDQGMGDLGSSGNPYIKTPNLDEFYNESVRLTNFHVSTTCAPTRGAIMTGRHTNRINVFHTIAGRSLLFEDEVILPQILAQNGYTNGMFGKWHLGDNYPYRPEDRGFHEVVRHGGGGITQGPDYWGNDYFDDTYWHNSQIQKYKGYCTDVFFSEAISFIEENKNEPFFCYISTNAPHGPLNLPKEYLDMYKNVKGLEEQYQRFYGMITNIDDNFKLLQNKLDDLKIADNTILIFMTDNGTASGNKVYDAGLRGAKGSEYEGGHRVPLFIRWPDGQLTGGKDIDKLAAAYDLLPTFVDLLALDFNPVKPLDGKSLKPLLYNQGADWPNRILYIDTQRLQNLVKYRKYSVMDDNWRFVNGTELYNMNDDRSQTKNIIGQHPEVVEKLALGYEKWWQSFMDEGVNERYAYIKVGTAHENPSRISAHDMLTGKFGSMWHQYGAVRATQASGRWKIEFVEDGDYEISLCRFPRESGLAINEIFPAQEKIVKLDKTMPASVKNDFEKAYLYVADVDQNAKIEKGQKEVSFTAKIAAGKYDMEAQLIDKDNRVHPAYYVYIEKL